MASPLKLDLTLQEICMTQVAINCWQRQKIKNKINEFFLTNDVTYVAYRVAKKLHDWTYEVLEDFVYVQRSLPMTLKRQMTHIITSVGRRMIRWLEHKIGSPMPRYYLDNIHWTTHGTIDEVKIFKALCNNSDVKHLPYLYTEACVLCLEDEVKNLWEKLSTEQRDIFSRVDSTDWKFQLPHLERFPIYLLPYWLQSNKEDHLFKKLSLFHDGNRMYNVRLFTRVNYFTMSVFEGLEAAARHFFDQLTDDEKNETLVKTTVMLVNKKLSDSELQASYCFNDYDFIKYVDTLTFLLQKISIFQSQYLSSRCAVNILEVLLFLWPWQNLFIPVVKQFSNYLRFFDYVQLLSTIIERIICEADVICDIENLRIYQILLDMWAEVPVSFKVQMVEDSPLLFCRLPSKTGNSSFLKHIVDDPDLASQREELLANVENYFHDLFIEGKHDVVDSILRVGFSYSQEEYINFKRTLDNSDVCKHFLSEGLCYDLDEFLMWQFDSQDEVARFKTEAKSSNLNVSILCHIWNFGRPRCCKNLIKDFFDFFIYDETDKKNLQEQLINSEEFKKIQMSFTRSGHIDDLETLLNCRDFSDENRQMNNQCST